MNFDPNVTVAPYLTARPAGAPAPVASTPNSWDGSVAANAAIVPAGSGGATRRRALPHGGYFSPQEFKLSN